MRRAFLVLCLTMLLGAAHAKPVEEAWLVGTWEPSTRSIVPFNGQPRITFRADHTCMHVGGAEEGPAIARGIWHLRGNELVTRFRDNRVVREMIVSITAHELTTRYAGTTYVYRRLKSD
jgi:hypothetical protein